MLTRSMKSGAAALAVAIAAAAAAPGLAAGAFPTVSPAQVAQWQERGETFLFIDTRPALLFENKHARGAINLPAFAIGSKPLPRAAKVVVYDGGAGATEAEQAARGLQEKGHPEFYVLEGGLTAWEAQGFPIVVVTGSLPGPLVEPIGAEDLMRMIDDGARVTILDLRPSDLYRQSRVPGARSASTDPMLESAARGVLPSDLVVLYDDGDGSARDRAEALRRKGYRAVKYLHGGMLAWREKKLRVER